MSKHPTAALLNLLPATSRWRGTWSSAFWRGTWGLILTFLMGFQSAQVAYARGAWEPASSPAGVIPVHPSAPEPAPMPLVGEPDISGSWKDVNGYVLNLYQSGTSVTGDWTLGSTKYNVVATVSGSTFSGSMKNPTTGVAAYTFTNMAISADAKSITGYVAGYATLTWTKQPGVIIQVTPNTPAIAKPGDVLSFVGAVGGATDKSITWSASAGTVVNGSYTVPTGVDYTLQTVTATSNADPTKKAVAQVSVTPTGFVDVSGTWKDVNGYVLNLYQAGARVFGDWTLGGNKYAVDATVSGYTFSGTMKNPATGVAAYTFTNMAIGPDAKTITGYMPGYANLTWTRQPGVIIQVTPGTPTIAKPGDVLTYVGSVGGVGDKSITWTASAGNVVDGVYTVPTGVDHSLQTVTATSNADPTKKAVVQVSVSPTGIIDISGAYKDANGYVLNLYQSGARVYGDWTLGGNKYVVDATVSGYTFSGTMRNPTTSAAAYTFSNMAISPDAKTITGYVPGYANLTWTRQPGIIMQVTPTGPTIARPGDVIAYVGSVGGTGDKSIAWSATAGSVVNGSYTVPTGVDYSVQTVTGTAVADPTKKVTAQVSVTPTGILDISGVWKDANGYHLLNLYQSGTIVTGTWQVGGNTLTFEGTVSGYQFSGVAKYATGVTGYTFSNFTIGADAKGFAGYLNGYGNTTWTKQPGVIVRISPSTPTIVKAGDQVSYQAQVGGVPNKDVVWEATAGAVSNGLYTTPSGLLNTAQTISAIAAADPSKRAMAQVTITEAGMLSLGGVYKDANGFQLVILQNGTAITGEWNPWGSKLALDATLSGYGLVGKFTQPPSTATTYTFTNWTVSPDCKTISGYVNGYGNVTFTRQGNAVAVVVSPAAVTVRTGATFQFAGSVSGMSNAQLSWTILEVNGGTLSQSGLYTAPTTAGAYTVKATSVGDPTKSAQAVVTVKPPVVVAPQTWTLSPGGVLNLSTQMTGFTNAAVTWSATGGTITPEGRYTAPEEAGTYQVTATSVEDPTKSGSATITVPFYLSILPESATVATGRTVQFQATVSGATNKAVQWEIVAPGLGTLTPEGLYTAPLVLPDPVAGGYLRIKATSIARPTQSKETVLYLKSSVLVAPQKPTVKPGASLAFQATLNGVSGGVTWTASGGTLLSTSANACSWKAPDVAGTYTLTATSTEDGALVGATEIKVPVVVTLENPSMPSMLIPTGLGFGVKVKVEGSTNKKVTWSTEGIALEEIQNSGGSMGSGSGTGSNASSVGYGGPQDPGAFFGHGPKTPRTFTLVAQADADPNAVQRITVSALAMVAINPVDVIVPAEQSYTFKDVMAIGMTLGFDGSGYVIGSRLSEVVDVETTGGQTEWLNADRITGLNGVTYRFATAQDPPPTGGSSVGMAANSLNDLKYTAPDTAGVYYISLKPKLNPDQPTKVKIQVPFTITISHDVPARGMALGGQAHFSATVSGSPNKAVDWSVMPQSYSLGTIDASGNYTAPTEFPANVNTSTVLITARSQADPSKFATVTFTLSRPAYFQSLYTWYSALTPVQMIPAFAGQVLNVGDFTWSASAGTVTPDGIWTLPDLEGNHTVTAVSKADPRVVATGTTRVPFQIKFTPESTVTLPAGGTQAFQAQVLGHPDKRVTWSATAGSITSDGVYTAPASFEGATLNVTIYAKSLARPDFFAGVNVTVTNGFSIYPKALTFSAGQQSAIRFWAYLNGQVTTATWSASAGTVESNGLWTVPSQAGTYTVTATNPSNPAESAAATVTINPVVKVEPGNAGDLRIGSSFKFNATVLGLADQRVTWSTTAPAGMDPDGTFHAPATLSGSGAWNTFYVTATSQANPSLSATSIIYVRNPLALTPATQTVQPGRQATLGLTVVGVTGAMVWSTTGGTITQTGVYTAPAEAGTYTVTVTSVDEPSLSVSATITVPISVKVNPASTLLPMGFTQGFMATVSGDPLNRVTWSAAGATPAAPSGTINQFGAYTPPTTPGLYTVTATSQVDPTQKASATVKVPQPLLLSPERATLKPGGSVRFTPVGTTPTGTPTVTWQATAGTVAADGTYTAPTALGTYRVTATSTTDAAVQAVAEVRVTAAGAVTVELTPTSLQLKKGETVAFTATVGGATNPALTWSTTGGTIEPDGHYTAPTQFGTFRVYATSVEDPTAEAIATIVVSAQAGEDQAFTYDENGNLLSDGERTFEWDVENRLVAVTKGTHRSEFEYDPLGRRSRIIEKDADGQGGWTTGSDKRYLWERAEIVEEEAADGSTLKAFYGQGFVDTDATLLFYTRDHLGSVRELVDAQGAVRARYDYDPYGRVTKVSGDRDSLFLYTGHLWHQQSRLFLTRYRAFDSEFGRWISRDPIGFDGGMNDYAYVDNGPIWYTDPDGLSAYPQKKFPYWHPHCRALEQKILRLQKEVEEREHEYLTNPQRLPFFDPNQPGKCTAWGHIPDYQRNLESLLKNIQRYINECDGPNGPGSGPPGLPYFDPTRERSENSKTSGTDLHARAVAAGTWAVVLYWVVSETSRLWPPRNLVPIP